MTKYKSRPHILIIDDEPNFAESLKLALEDAFTIETAGSLRKARELLGSQLPEAVLLDIRLPDGDGISFLRELKGTNPLPVIMLMTAFAAVDDAVTALKEGADDYFTKPVDIEKLKRELRVYFENRSLQKRITVLNREIQKISPPFVTSGAGKMTDIVNNIPIIAPLNIPVLLRGETGTGKEKLALWIHGLSGLQGEFVALNCSALPRDILESELFGHTKGAFTGALAYKEGLIERADGGTLFLDEIGELSETAQAKLLRVLEEGAYYKLGETSERRVNFRLISATNKDLARQTVFRQDLFFRINGITFELPPLRERPEDIPLLVSTFLNDASKAYNKDIHIVSDEAMQYFVKNNWPGNIRELKWTIHRAVAIASAETLGMNDVAVSSGIVKETGTTAPLSDFSVPLQEAMNDLEKRYLEHALSVTNNNKTEAAKLLGLSVRVLHYKLKQYRIS